LFSAAGNLFAQEPAVQSILLDSAEVKESEGSTYEIGRLRLLRWVRAHQDTSARDVLVQILNLLSEADSFARQNDYITAQLILDTALELTRLRAAPTIVETEPAFVEMRQEFAPLAKSEWRREILFGVDLWQQKYELGAFSADTIFSDGNPFVGLRLSINHDPARVNLGNAKSSPLRIPPESRSFKFDAYALLKSSRDYYSGEVEFNARQSLGRGSYWRIQNRLEGTSYHRDFNLQYWQNMTSALAVAEVNRNFRLEVADELRWRRYHSQTDFYPNYIQNRASLGVAFNSGFTTRLDTRYNYIVQAHGRFSIQDYLEHRVESSIFQSSAANSSIALENIWRKRIYPNNFSTDTSSYSYLQTYQEEYARADLQFGLVPAFALRIEGDFVLRQYQTPSDSVPDFLGVTVNPQLQFNLSPSLQIRAGYLYALRVYENNLIQENPSSTAASASPLFYEDYYSHGFTMRIDLIRTDALLFSISEIFEMRTYPHSAAYNISDLGLYSYTDRNINSLLLFFSWNFQPRWQANVLANFDNDYSRLDDQSDSRNTLFSIDLAYSF
jgi:hypothetical protein